VTAILVEGRRINPPPPENRLLGHTPALTSRELEVLRDLARGLTRKEVAAAQYVAVPTVQAHVANAFMKLGVGSLIQAMNVLGWVCTE